MAKIVSLGWYFAGAVAAGAAMGVANSMGIGFDAVLWVGGLLMILGTPFVLWWWKHADEAVREAHKWAWFWGGGTGLLVGLIWGIADARLGQRGLEGVFSNYIGTPLTVFEGGMLFLMLTMSAGYLAGWAIWWLRHR